jgi:hypothetical protein
LDHLFVSSSVQGVIRDIPVRLRLKDRVPEQEKGTPCRHTAPRFYSTLDM